MPTYPKESITCAETITYSSSQVLCEYTDSFLDYLIPLSQLQTLYIALNGMEK